MPTTIQVSEETKEVLDRYRKEVSVETYEDAITRLLRESGGDSAFGSMRGWGSWSDEDRMRYRTDEREL
jgi:Arc/MetJ family transcription regulator